MSIKHRSGIDKNDRNGYGCFLYTQRGNHHEWFYHVCSILIKCSKSVCIHFQKEKKKKKESTLNLSAFILPARQMMVLYWIRSCGSKLEKGIVLILVQVALCRCNRAKSNWAQMTGNNNLPVCSPFTSRSWGSGLPSFKHAWLRTPQWFCFSQCSARSCCLSRRKRRLPSPKQDHPGCHPEAGDEPRRCWITVRELNLVAFPASPRACAGTGVCHEIPAMSSLLRGLPQEGCDHFWCSPHLYVVMESCQIARL